MKPLKKLYDVEINNELIHPLLVYRVPVPINYQSVPALVSQSLDPESAVEPVDSASISDQMVPKSSDSTTCLASV